MTSEPPPPRASLPMALIIALSGFGLFVTIVFVVMMIGGVGRRVASRTERVITAPLSRPMVSAEAYPSSRVVQSGETALNASNADQVVSSGSETTFTKTFPLDGGTSFSLKNTNGSITVTAWDQPWAEVKAIQNASEIDRQVFFTIDPGRLSVRTARTNRNQEVRFEVRLPSELGRIDLNSVNGSINISNVSAAITIQNVNGAIELTMKPGYDAHLEASTAQGSINIGDQYGIAVQKEDVGQRARGQIGSGGQLLKLTTVTGSIKLTNGNAQQVGSDGPRLKLTTVNGSIKLTNRNTQQTSVNGKIKLAK